MPRRRAVAIHTDQIALGALLKWAGVVATGGDAKTLIAEERVRVNGEVETRRGRRLTDGDVVAVQGGPVLVVTRDTHDSSPQARASLLP